ncbi:MAG: hypothetical protein AAGE18_19205 [Pseudomonadota bacterium]
MGMLRGALSLVGVCLAGPALAWDLAEGPHGWQAEIADGGQAPGVTLACSRGNPGGAAFPGPAAERLPVGKGQYLLFVALDGFSDPAAIEVNAEDAQRQYALGIAVDDTDFGAAPSVYFASRRALATLMPANHPLIAQMAAGATLTLTEQASGARMTRPLAGFAPALQRFATFCGGDVSNPTANQAPPPPRVVERLTPGVPVLNGSALDRRLALWILNRRPAFLDNENLIRNWYRQDLPDRAAFQSFSRLPQVEQQTRLAQFKALLRQQAQVTTVPPRAALLSQTQLSRFTPGQGWMLSGPFQEGTRELSLNNRFLNSQIRLQLRNRPTLHLLPIDEVTGRTLQQQARGGMLLGALLALENPAMTSDQYSSGQGILTMEATVLDAGFYVRPDGARGQTDLVPPLAERNFTWQVPEPLPRVWEGEAPRLADFDLATTEGLTALYGAPTLGDRVLSGELQDRPRTAHLPRPGDARVAGLALALQAVREVSPEAVPDSTLAEQIVGNLLSQAEQDQFLPIQRDRYGQLALNEFERQSVFEAIGEPLIQAVTARAPTLPIGQIAVQSARLGEYDMARQGFPLEARYSFQLWPQFARGEQPVLTGLPGFLPMPRAEAEALVNRLGPAQRGGRQVWLGLETELRSLRVAGRRATLITEESLGRVVPYRAVRGLTIYADPGLQRQVASLDIGPYLAVPAGAPLEPLPESAYLSTPDVFLGHLARLGQHALVRQMVALQLGATQADAASEDAIAEELARLDRLADGPLWAVATLSVGPYVEETGLLPVTGAAVAPVVQTGGALGLVRLEPADTAQLTQIEVGREAADRVLAEAGGAGLVRVLARVRPISAEVPGGDVGAQPILRLALLEEAYLLTRDPITGEDAVLAPVPIAPTSAVAVPGLSMATSGATGEGAAKAPDAPPSAPPPAGLKAADVLGLTLGMPLAEFQAMAEDRYDDGVPLTRATADPTQLPAAGMLSAEADELLLALSDPAEPQAPLVAIYRRKLFPADRVSADALVAALEQKYGPGQAAAAPQGRALAFGGPCAPALAEAGDIDLAPDDMPPVLWPVEGAAGEGCGPSLSVVIEEREEGRVLHTWLIDPQALAEARAALTPEEPPEEVEIEL